MTKRSILRVSVQLEERSGGGKGEAHQRRQLIVEHPPRNLGLELGGEIGKTGVVLRCDGLE